MVKVQTLHMVIFFLISFKVYLFIFLREIKVVRVGGVTEREGERERIPERSMLPVQSLHGA